MKKENCREVGRRDERKKINDINCIVLERYSYQLKEDTVDFSQSCSFASGKCTFTLFLEAIQASR